jgi:hypothetical protein
MTDEHQQNRSRTAEKLSVTIAEPLVNTGPDSKPTVNGSDSVTFILMSFCNVKSKASRRLALFDSAQAKPLALKLPETMPRSMGTTGLAGDDNYIYAATQVAQSARGQSRFLLTFSRRDLSLVCSYAFKRAIDVHSMCWSRGRLMVVSSGTDEIIQLTISQGLVTCEQPFWCPETGSKQGDCNHLSGICESPDGLIICGFGKRENEGWSSATNGFLFNVDRRECVLSGLQQPHSIMHLRTGLVFCESRNMAVRRWEGDLRQLLPGYTRGMCIAGDFLYVATSVGRKTSRSTGHVIENPCDSGAQDGECTVSCLAPATLNIFQTTKFATEGEEIYDLLAVNDISRWPVVEN